VVRKIRASLFLLTLLILGITTLCVSSNFTEMVIERSKEIGILKAIGGVERKIAAFFVSESAVLALAATIAGYAAGVFAAAAIGREVFGGVFRVQPIGSSSPGSPALCWPLRPLPPPSPHRASGASSPRSF
jgi:ABC-type antimicrobial peptide transport system permease subunit